MVTTGPATIPGQWATDSHGGQGPYFVRTLLTSEFRSSLKYIRDLTLKAGSSIGMHPHVDDEEVYLVISGRGVMTVDGETWRIGPGDVTLTQPGSSHGLRADLDSDLHILVACAGVPASGKAGIP